MSIQLSDFQETVTNLKSYHDNYQNNKLHKKIVEELKQNNKHLSAMQEELKIANATNKRILSIEIEKQENKEEQRYYKALSFHIHELIDEIAKIQDKMVLTYMVNNYYEKLQNSLVLCKDILDEIDDKRFNKTTLEQLDGLRSRTTTELPLYQESILSRIDQQISSFEDRKEKLLNEPIPESQKVVPDLTKPKKDKDRITVIIILTVLSPLLITIIPLIIIVIYHFSAENKKLTRFKELKKKEMAKHKQKILMNTEEIREKRKLELLNDPVYAYMKIIQDKHPVFKVVTKKVNQLSSEFYNKWSTDVINA